MWTYLYLVFINFLDFLVSVLVIIVEQSSQKTSSVDQNIAPSPLDCLQQQLTKPNIQLQI